MPAAEIIATNLCTHIILDDFVHFSTRGPTERPNVQKSLETLAFFQKSRPQSTRPSWRWKRAIEENPVSLTDCESAIGGE